MSDPNVIAADLVLRSWHNADREAGLGGEEFFTPDGVCEMPARTMTGRAEIAAGYAARQAAGARLSRHLVTNLLIRDTSSDSWEAAYGLVLYAGTGTAPLPLRSPQAVCDVTDRFVRSGTELLIAHRRLEAVFLDEATDSVMLRQPR
ncbi:hypothetical protein GCM10022222_28410 [Amycolatopsis ultiminotia]|uniref:SnoaL-like domain-containing protein n=1 Tax=Amycolatopsis ultiminotia TaxID=543629 RepID=A0ABP6VYN3_9PSEU